MLDVAIAAGLDVDRVCEGLPFDAASVRKLRRVDWEHYGACVERLETLAGGPHAVRAITRAHYYTGIEEFRRVAGMVIKPKTLVRFVHEVLDPLVFPTIDFVYRDRGPAHVRVETWMRPAVRSFPAVFRCTTGAYEALPTIIGYPFAKVDERIFDDHATWDIHFAEVKTARDRTRSVSIAALARAMRTLVLGGDLEGAPFGVSLATPDVDIEPRVELAAQSWTLTQRHTEVLRVLVGGKSNKEIAATIGCAESTVELYVTQILGRAAAPSRGVLIARFWSEF